MLGKRISNLRKQKKLTQENVSKMLGIHRGTYANYEAGRREPDNETLHKLADFFNVSIDYLLGRSEDTNSNVLVDPIISLLNDPSLSEEDKDIIERIRDLPPNKKHLVKELLKAFEAETNK